MVRIEAEASLHQVFHDMGLMVRQGTLLFLGLLLLLWVPLLIFSSGNPTYQVPLSSCTNFS